MAQATSFRSRKRGDGPGKPFRVNRPNENVLDDIIYKRHTRSEDIIEEQHPAQDSLKGEEAAQNLAQLIGAGKKAAITAKRIMGDAAQKAYEAYHGPAGDKARKAAGVSAEAIKSGYYIPVKLADRIFKKNPRVKSFIRDKYNKFVIGTTLAGMLTAGTVGGAWLHSYNKRFGPEKFTQEYVELNKPDANIILGRDGEEIGTIRGRGDKHVRRVDVHGAALEPLIKMLSSKEDKYIMAFDGIEHEGLLGLYEAYSETFHWKPKLRAAAMSVLTGDLQGGSELFCQLAKNMYMKEPHTIWFDENSLLGRIEYKLVQNLNGIKLATMYKADPDNPELPLENMILDYVNNTYATGPGNGLEVFIKSRFDKSIEDVLVPQDLQEKNISDEDVDKINILAYYVASLTRPETYNPFSSRIKTPEKRQDVEEMANKRKDLMINILGNNGHIDKFVEQRCLERDLQFKEGKFLNSVTDHSFENIREEGIEKLKKEGHYWKAHIFDQAGLSISTTLDDRMQDATLYFLQRDKSVIDTLQYGFETEDLKPSVVKTLRPFTIYNGTVRGWRNGNIHINLGEFYPNVVIPIERDYSAEIYNKLKKKLEIGDVIPVGVRSIESGDPVLDIIKRDTEVEGAAMITNINGDVAAMAGGQNLNNPVQLGSMYKLLLTDLALRKGWSAKDVLNNEPGLEFERWSDKTPYSPSNYDEERINYPEHPTLGKAFAKSINVPMVYLLSHLTEKMGMEEIEQEAQKSSLSLQDVTVTNDKVWLNHHDWIDMGKDDWQELVFEKIKKEKLIANQRSGSADYETMREISDYSFEEFQKGMVDPEPRQIKKVKRVKQKKGLGAFLAGLIGEASTETIYVQAEANENTDMPSQRFTVKDYQDWKSQLEMLKSSEKNPVDINKELLYYHPEYQSYLSVEIFKNYLASHGIDKDKIRGDLSLVLGTHETSIKDFNRIVREVLAKPSYIDYSAGDAEDGSQGEGGLIRKIENKHGDVLYESQKPEEVRGIENYALYDLMKSGRQYGTGRSLRSSIIKGTKTGTTDNTVAVTGVLEKDGEAYIATVYEANPKKDLPDRIVSGARNAGKVLDSIAYSFSKE